MHCWMISVGVLLDDGGRGFSSNGSVERRV